MAGKNKKNTRGKSLVQKALEQNKELDHVIVTELMRDAQSQGACEDWPDIKGICLNAARLMVQSMPAEDCYDLLRNAVHLYDKEVVCNLYRSVPRTQRLAYFISQVAISMRDNSKFLDWFVVHELDDFSNLEQGTLLGLIIRRIATQDALNVCSRYFRADLLRANRFEQLRMKRKRLQSQGQSAHSDQHAGQSAPGPAAAAI